jgi:multidrug efflux pump subunit AcrA (membrane-fusion protein)
MVAAAAGLLGFLSLAGVLPRVLHRADMAEEERALAEEPASVSVVRVERSNEASNLSLPGSVEALQETSVYARANGYVRAWLVDIGAHVRKGQTLAELEVPDVDEELRQQQAAANQALQGVTPASIRCRAAEQGPPVVLGPLSAVRPKFWGTEA